MIISYLSEKCFTERLRTMNATVISLSILVGLSCNVRVASGTFLLLRFQLVIEGFLNSFFNSEIIMEGTRAEEIYFMERADQITKLDNALKKRAKLAEKKESAKKLSIFDLNPTRAGLKVANVGRLKYQLYALDEKIEKLNNETGSNKFCSIPDICDRAFKNSYFTEKNHWILRDEDSTKTKCVEKTIVVENGGKSFADMRKYVKCKTINEKDGNKGPDVFLEVSTKYVPGKNLKYFVLVDDKGYMKPVAYLMNKKESNSIEIPIDEAQKPLRGEKASKMDVHS